MPEGDAIWLDARRLRDRVVGVPLVALESRWPQIVRGLSVHRIHRIDTHGKNLMLRFDNAQTLRIHRQMAGFWRWFPHHHFSREDLALAILTEHGADVCYRAPTVQRLDDRELPTHPVLSVLGPDVLDPDFDPHAALARAHQEMTSGEALLDQTVAAGIGNTYRAEALFFERVHPWLPLRQVRDPARLWKRASALMVANLAPGRREMQTRTGGPPHNWVYGRDERPCVRCGRTIQRGEMGTFVRSIYWCPRCQPEGGVR